MTPPTRCRRGRPAGPAAPAPRAVLLYLEELDLEDQRLVGADTSAGAAGAIGELGRNEYLPLAAGLHELKRLLPALDDALERKRRRRVTAVGTVELGAVEERAAVVDHHRVIDRGLFTFALGEHLVLQAGVGGHDAFALAVLRQKGLAGGLCVLGPGALGLHLLFP